MEYGTGYTCRTQGKRGDPYRLLDLEPEFVELKNIVLMDLKEMLSEGEI
jgi:hypothetical protein